MIWKHLVAEKRVGGSQQPRLRTQQKAMVSTHHFADSTKRSTHELHREHQLRNPQLAQRTPSTPHAPPPYSGHLIIPTEGKQEPLQIMHKHSQLAQLFRTGRRNITLNTLGHCPMKNKWEFSAPSLALWSERRHTILRLLPQRGNKKSEGASLEQPERSLGYQVGLSEENLSLLKPVSKD